MARYIDADKLKELIKSFTGMFTDDSFMVDLFAVLRAIDNAETANVAPMEEVERLKKEVDKRVPKLIITKKPKEQVMSEYIEQRTEAKQTPIVANNTEYIDKQALLDEFERWNFGKHGQLEKHFADRAFAIIDKVPTAPVHR